MLVAVVKSGIVFALPPEVVTGDTSGGTEDAEPPAGESPNFVATVVLVPIGEAASTKADGGSPPTVSASAALSAYGTATSSTRACSDSPAICSASQRASPVINISAGKPSLRVV